MANIGITSTIPVEVVYAAGHTPVDLNNIFITSSDPAGLVRKAEEDGLPRNLCSWVKGIYAALMLRPDIKTVIAVTEGDCSNTLSMLDTISQSGVDVVTFSYPYDRDASQLECSISRLESFFSVSRKDSEEMRDKLNIMRKKAQRIDELTWLENKITGLENHISLISCSDFNGDPEKFEKDLDQLIEEAEQREPLPQKIRIGFCGVPTIFSDLYDFLESKGARAVYNEMQRQFAMPDPGESITQQYLNYTYPYSYSLRVEDIKEEAKKRNLDGIIHYIQSFCHHQIHDRRLKESLDYPVLTLEGDKPGVLLENSKIRIESFLEMLEI